MAESRIRRAYHDGFTSRWTGNKKAPPFWEIRISWDSSKVPLITGKAFANSFGTEARKARLSGMDQIPVFEARLEAADEAVKEIQSLRNAHKPPQRSDFAKGPKGQINFELAQEDHERIAEKLEMKLREVIHDRSDARHDLKRARESVNDSAALMELRYRHELATKLKAAAEVELERCELGLAVFEADEEAEQVTGPRFDSDEDRERLLATFSGQSGTDWLRSKVNGKLSEVVQRIRERVAA